MYVKEYWGNYIGGTDDSLNLIAYLEDKKKKDILLSEIFIDLGLNRLNGVFTETAVPLEYTHSNGICMDFHFAIDIITDLAALLLECKKSGYVNLHDFDEYNMPDVVTHITATHEEYILIIKTLKDFASAPLTYDLSEMVPEDDMKEMAEICDKLRLELEKI